MKKTLLTLFLVSFSLSVFSQKFFEYQNPIRSGIQHGIRDAQIFEDNGKYYLIGTSYPFWPREGKNPGVKIYSSDDLLNWKFEKLLIDRSELDTCVWYLDRFWAPEMQKINGKYYLTFNCQNESTVNCRIKGQKGGVAVSDNILGPFKVVTHDAPLVNGNDLTLFEDNDGKVYAFWNGSKRISAAEVDLKNMELVDGTERVLFRPDEGTWDAIGIEGAYCIKKDEKYYLFYSSWTRGYEIGYATADHPLGPWTKFEGNPVFGAQNKEACERNNIEFTGNENNFWRAVGHNEVWEGPDGRLWISCHGIPKENPVPGLVIEPIDFINDEIVIGGPTHTPQAVLIEKSIKEKSIEDRVADRDYPSVFQAWYPIDMPEYPLETNEQRLKAAAKHDLLWEEPLSQLGEGHELVLGLVWDHENHGLADRFTAESLKQAIRNREKLLKMNPNMVFLMEIRWRDAPMSFLPESSDWWLRDEDGEIVKGWLGGWEPFYKLNYENEEFQDNVARQSRIALQSGVYDGVMLDWSGNLEIIKKVRKAIGDSALIIVNIHDNIEDGEKYEKYINGSFMELNPIDETATTRSNKGDWDNIRKALIWFEKNLQEPAINCLEVWGDRDDLSRMRATTTLGLTHSDGYVLYADPNPLKTPDHLHNWYDFWDVELGNPLGKREVKEDGAVWREFEGGIVIYNHFQNGKIKIKFKKKMKRVSDGKISKKFKMNDRDGDIFVNP